MVTAIAVAVINPMPGMSTDPADLALDVTSLQLQIQRAELPTDKNEPLLTCLLSHAVRYSFVFRRVKRGIHLHPEFRQAFLSFSTNSVMSNRRSPPVMATRW